MKVVAAEQLKLKSGGTATAPAIAPVEDVDTGILFPADNELDVVAGGARQINVTPDGVSFDNPIAAPGVQASKLTIPGVTPAAGQAVTLQTDGTLGVATIPAPVVVTPLYQDPFFWMEV